MVTLPPPAGNEEGDACNEQPLGAPAGGGGGGLVEQVSVRFGGVPLTVQVSGYVKESEAAVAGVTENENASAAPTSAANLAIAWSSEKRIMVNSLQGGGTPVGKQSTQVPRHGCKQDRASYHSASQRRNALERPPVG